jgi:membrane-associated protein
MGMMQQLTDLIFSFGLTGIAAVIFIESAFPFGFFLPGDTVLFTAGLLASKGHFTLVAAMVLIFIANFVGVTIGYYIGRHVGKRYVKKESKLLFRHEYVEKAEEFYKRHGGKAIILGRFIPAVRSFVPIIAGIAKMDYRELMIYNAIGAAIWAIGVTALGYYAGAWLENHGINVDALILPIILIIIVLSLAGPFVHALSDSKTREQLLARFKR